jgi:hypothetical protein
MSVSKSAPPAAALSARTGDGGLCSFAGLAKGGLPAPEAAALEPAEDLLGPGTAGFATGGGLLLPGAVDFAPPRARFTLRIGSPTLVIARRFRAHLDDPCPSLLIQQQQYSVHKEKSSIHGPYET